MGLVYHVLNGADGELVRACGRARGRNEGRRDESKCGRERERERERPGRTSEGGRERQWKRARMSEWVNA